MKIADFNQAVASFLYSVAQIAQGLFFHPYQTMQSLVRERVFFWLTFLPTAIWVIAHLLWRLAIVPAVSLVFSCAETGLVVCQLIPLFSSWLFYFCLFWQVMLLYLFLRFLLAFSAKN